MSVELNRVGAADRQYIQTYKPGEFVVSGVRMAGSIVVLPDRTMPWPVSDPDSLTAGDFLLFDEIDAPLDLLLLGGGARFMMPPVETRLKLRQRGIVIEPMATPAACRTYNLLASEGRRVAAALLAVPLAT